MISMIIKFVSKTSDFVNNVCLKNIVIFAIVILMQLELHWMVSTQNFWIRMRQLESIRFRSTLLVPQVSFKWKTNETVKME